MSQESQVEMKPKKRMRRQLSTEELIASAKGKKRVTYKELVALGHIPWDSWKTTKRKIENENFPAIPDGPKWYFEVAAVELWFKKRQTKAA